MHAHKHTGHRALEYGDEDAVGISLLLIPDRVRGSDATLKWTLSKKTLRVHNMQLCRPSALRVLAYYSCASCSMRGCQKCTDVMLNVCVAAKPTATTTATTTALPRKLWCCQRPFDQLLAAPGL
jgi:hypothetical protein